MGRSSDLPGLPRSTFIERVRETKRLAFAWVFAASIELISEKTTRDPSGANGSIGWV
jgi:hypothetical protein